MKHLKLFENINDWDQRLRTNVKDREILDVLIKQYLYWKLGTKEDDAEGYYIWIYDFYFKDGWFTIRFEQGGEDEEYFKVKDYNELLKFIENPDLFKEQEKYNL